MLTNGDESTWPEYFDNALNEEWHADKEAHRKSNKAALKAANVSVADSSTGYATHSAHKVVVEVEEKMECKDTGPQKRKQRKFSVLIIPPNFENS